MAYVTIRQLGRDEDPLVVTLWFSVVGVLVSPILAAVLQGLGDYIRTCHSDAAAVARGSGAGLSFRLDFNFTFINRVILQEDLSVGGQIVQAFKVEVLPAGGWVLLATPANEKNLASAAPSSSLTRAH